MKLVINATFPSLNEYVNACRTNVFKANNMKKTYQSIVVATCIKQRLGELKTPIKLNVKWYEPNNKRDLDNVFFSIKFILDGLVQYGAIQDDSRKYVTGINNEIFTDKENPRIEVEIEEEQ